MGEDREPGACQPPPQDGLHVRIREPDRRRWTEHAAILSRAREGEVERAPTEEPPMTLSNYDDRALAVLDTLIDEITLDAHGDDEKFWAFRQAFEDNIVVPVDAFVIGEPVSVIAFEYDGNARRGLTARCRRADGAEHVVAAYDVVLPENADAKRY